MYIVQLVWKPSFANGSTEVHNQNLRQIGYRVYASCSDIQKGIKKNKERKNNNPVHADVSL